MTKIFQSTQQSPGPDGYPERSGQPVTIVRALTAEEADLQDVGPMFRIRFADGLETDAFGDELLDYIIDPHAARGPLRYVWDGFRTVTIVEDDTGAEVSIIDLLAWDDTRESCTPEEFAACVQKYMTLVV
jgi:hypothetical protein